MEAKKEHFISTILGAGMVLCKLCNCIFSTTCHKPKKALEALF
jgi:hypothetical protein